MKKIISCILALCLIVPFAFLLSGCGEAQASNSVTLSVNPEVSFVLDSNDKVLSISYENEDAGIVLSNVNFVGLDINEALQKFIENSVITGHVVLSDDVFTIEVTGVNDEKITELENQIKSKVETVFENLGATISVEIKNIEETAKREALEAKAILLSPEKTGNEIAALTTEELLKLINDKQKQYEGLAYSQINNIQEAFSAAQNAVLQSIQELKAAIEQHQATIQSYIDTYGDQIPALIQTQIDSLQALIDLSKDQIDTLVSQAMEALDTLINNAKAVAEQTLASLQTQFSNQVATAKTGFIAHLDAALNSQEITQEQYNYWKALVENN